jgi:hypothetical protein
MSSYLEQSLLVHCSDKCSCFPIIKLAFREAPFLQICPLFRQSGLELEIMLQSLERLENNKEDAYDVIYIRLFTYLAVLLKIPKFVKVP